MFVSKTPSCAIALRDAARDHAAHGGFMIKKGQQGFTLFEVLVAISIFAAVIAMAGSLLFTLLRVQRYAEQNQNVADNGRTALEVIARAIRVSTIFAPAANPSSSLTIDHPTEGELTYTLTDTGKIQVNGRDLTSPQVRMSRLQFFVSGVGVSDTQQPRVTIVLRVESPSATPAAQQIALDLQTTVTQRRLDL